jgi:hypothetical protein
MGWTAVQKGVKSSRNLHFLPIAKPPGYGG